MIELENQKKRLFDLTTFESSLNSMISTNDQSYNGINYGRRYRQPLKDYSLSEIKEIINSGDLVSQQALSRNYFYKSGFYKQIIVYFANLLKYSGILIPNPLGGKKINSASIKRKYYSALDFIDVMNLNSFLSNCALRALIDGCYYGVILKLNKTIFTVIDLPARYCSTKFKDIYGNDVIDFDLTYFDTIISESKREEALSVYPKIFSRAYKKFKKGGNKWLRIPTDISICFPMFDGRPLFLNIIPATIDYDNAVETEKERDLEEIKKIIVQKIPHLNDGTLLFEPPEAARMHDGSVKMLRHNKNVSVLTTYADVEAIVSKTAADSASNNLEKMVNNIYYQAGTNGQLFSLGGSNTLKESITVNTSLMMNLAYKFSNFVTNTINSLFSSSTLRFKYIILPITNHNYTDFLDDSYKLATTGYSFILPALALGINQRDLENIKDLENNVLKLKDKLLPLESAYNSSGDTNQTEGGAPELDEEEKSEKTLENEESIDNQGVS